MTTEPTDFDGCRAKCRLAGGHTLVWGECEHAPEPEPTVSLPRVYTAADGHPCIGFDTYTVTALRDRIAEALLDHLSRTADIRPGRSGDLAFMPEVTDEERMRLADAVLAVLPVPSAPTTDPAVLRERIADVLADADGWTWAPGFDRRRSPAYQAYLTRADRVVGLLAAYDTTMRAAVLREAADFAEDVAESLRKHHEFERSTGALDVMTELRRLAAGAQQQPTTETPRRCAHTDIVYGRCVLTVPHDSECVHEHQPRCAMPSSDRQHSCVLPPNHEGPHADKHLADVVPNGGRTIWQTPLSAPAPEPLSPVEAAEARRCPAKHGALGRICELPAGHQGMHTGSGPHGGAVWDGDAS